MQFLTRLRTVWTAACFIGAVIFGLGYAGNPQPGIAALVLACLFAAYSFHASGTWRIKLSFLWLAASTAFVGAVLPRGPGPLLQVVLMSAGAWVAAVAVVYVAGGRGRDCSNISGTD